MPKGKSPPQQRVIFETENEDLRPVYVEGAQGGITPKGSLQVSFYLDFLKPSKQLKARITKTGQETGQAAFRISPGDPFGLDSNRLHFVRKIEATLVFTAPTLKSLIPWLQSKLDEMTQNESPNEPIKEPN